MKRIHIPDATNETDVTGATYVTDAADKRYVMGVIDETDAVADETGETDVTAVTVTWM